MENRLFLKQIQNEKITHFKGIIFEEEFDIKEMINYSYDKLIFEEVTFKKRADFSHFEFRQDLVFNFVNFEDYVTFNDSIFLENFKITNTTFNKEYLNEKIFEKIEFKGQNFIVENIKNLPRLDGILFSDVTKFILKKVDYKKNEYIYGKLNYRIARNQADKIGDYEKIGYYYYKERAYASHTMKESDYPTKKAYICAKFFDRLSKYTVGYGERPWNIFLITMFVISIFAFFYMFSGISYANNEQITNYIDLWYFSMITFSTVGYGDMLPSSEISKILITLEVFLGVTLAATWASVIIKRMIRE